MRERHVRESLVKTKRKPGVRAHAPRGQAKASGAPRRPQTPSAKVKTAKSTTAKPTRRPRPRLKPRPGQAHQAGKLDDELQKKLCGLIASGHRYEDACQLCGIARSTLHNWRAEGSAKPDGRYGRLLVEFEKADTLARAKMVKKLLDDPDWRATWKIMCNRWPSEFRESYALKQEISGPAGGPVPLSVTPFVVEIRCDESLENLDFGPIIDRTNGNGAG
jgi:hypothetical protein